MTPIQILILVFIAYVIARQVAKLRRRQISVSFFILWLIFWLSLGLCVVIPNILNRLADLLGVGRGADLAVYVAILLLFYLSFRMLLRQEQLEKNQLDLVRKIALDTALSNKFKEIPKE